MRQEEIALIKVYRFLILLGIFLGAFLFFASTVSGNEVFLKAQEIEVAKDQLTLGDLFNNLPQDLQQKIIGPSPGTGKKNLFSNRQLKEIASQNGQSYLGHSPLLIHRKSNFLTFEELLPHLQKAHLNWLATQNNQNFFKSKEYEFVVPPKHKKIEIPIVETVDVELVDYVYSAQSNFFSAKFQWASDASPNNPLPFFVLEGTAYPLVEIPVARLPIGHGKKITLEDLTMRPIRLEKLQGSVLSHPNDIVGMVAEAIIMPHQPIHKRQLRLPSMVKKNELVQMRIKTDSMALCCQGKAMQDGSKGEHIAVMNLSSKKIIQAKVTGENLVEVQGLRINED